MGVILKTVANVVQTRILCCVLVIIHNASGQASALALAIDSIDVDRVNSSYATYLTARAQDWIEGSNSLEAGITVLERPNESKLRYHPVKNSSLHQY